MNMVNRKVQLQGLSDRQRELSRKNRNIPDSVEQVDKVE